jgi:probable rRNA maturation factor
LNVKYYYKDTSFRLVKEENYNNLIDSIIKGEGYRRGEISIIFTSDKAILNLNKQFLKRVYTTDVIAFGNTFKNTVGGEVYLSVDRIKDNSKIYSEGDFDKEMKRVIIHGILHLIGYGDKTDREKELMTNKENFYLNS